MADSPERFAIAGMVPELVLAPHSVQELIDIVARAREEGWGLVPWGGGTSIEVGNRPGRYTAAVCSTGLAGIAPDYSPADLVVTASAGTTLADLQAFLAEHGQRLPLEAPASATLGGVVAGNVSGRLRLSRGTARDWLVGLQAVTGTGKAIRAGGRVVKNVTGYDFCKLFTGSRGTLGMLTELSFKVEPLPERAMSGIVTCADFPEVEAVRRVAMEAGAAWLELTVTGESGARDAPDAGPGAGSGRHGVVIAVEIGFEGWAADVEAQMGRVSAALRRECVSPPEWHPVSRLEPGMTHRETGRDALRDAGRVQGAWPDGGPGARPPETAGASPRRTEFEASRPDARYELRLGVLPDRLAALLASGPPARIQAHLGSGIATIRPISDERLAHGQDGPLALTTWRRLASEAGGWAIVTRRPAPLASAPRAAIAREVGPADTDDDVFGPPRAEWALGHEIKRVLDPDGVWSPGRGPGKA